LFCKFAMGYSNGDGLVLRYSNGGLIQDLDNDGYEQRAG